MQNCSEKKYNSLVAGAWLIDETKTLLEYLVEHDFDVSTLDKTVASKLKINSETARKRVLAEVKKRLSSVSKSSLEYFSQISSSNEKGIFNYYLCLKTYPIVFDFVSEVLLNKWRTRDISIDTSNVHSFIERKMDAHPELLGWTESTLNKTGITLFKILKEAGVIKDSSIEPLDASDNFWQFFIQEGDFWFLELALLNKQKREQILELTK